MMKKIITKVRNKYDKVLIKKLYKASKDKSIKLISEKYCEEVNIDYSENIRKAINNIVVDLNLKVGTVELESTEAYKNAKTNKPKKSKNYLITYAQDNTPIYSKVWEGMKTLAKEYNAEIIVIPGIYSNPQSEAANYSTGWHPDLTEYMFSGQHKLNNFLTIISDANVIPTAIMPLNGFEGITGEESSIVGHPRQHKVVVPTLPTSRDKLMATTGSITVPNYRRSRTGKKAEFHHISGFLVVEVFDKNDFVFRHVSANKQGVFQDLFYVVDGKEIRKDGKWDTLIMGDIHHGHQDEEMVKETFRLSEIGKPEYVLLHDVFDGSSINHHEAKDFVRQVINEKKGVTLKKELDGIVSWIRKYQSKTWQFVNIPSNHNDWLDKWVRLRDGKNDIKNAILYNEFQRVLFDELAPNGLVAYYLDENLDGVISLGRNDSFRRLGFELNNHGDLGANGARGTALTFKKLNVKIVSGDKHFLYTIDGAHGVGVTTHKFMGYNRGLSSWTQSHGVVNTNGKFQHLMFVGGRFTKLF